MPPKKTDSPAKRLARRGALIAGALATVWFAVEGGEYGTRDLFVQKSRRAALEADVADLRAEVDSLRAELKAVTTDPVRIERIAREEYGMVRGEKELLYWTVPRSGAPKESSGEQLRDVKGESGVDSLSH